MPEVTRSGFSTVNPLLFSCSLVSNSLWPHGLQHARFPCPSLSPGFFRLMSIESVMPSNHLTLSRPLLLLPSIFPSTGIFSSASALHIRWPKDGASASVLPMNNSVVISFWRDWFDLPAVQVLTHPTLFWKDFKKFMRNYEMNIWRYDLYCKLRSYSFGIRKTWIWISSLLYVISWRLIPLSLSFLLSKMRIIIPALQNCSKG